MNAAPYAAGLLQPQLQRTNHLAPGPPTRSPASVWHVIEGAATLTVGDGEGEGAEAPRFALAAADTACAPGYLPLTLANASAEAPAFVFVADESPLHQKLGLYETR